VKLLLIRRVVYLYLLIVANRDRRYRSCPLADGMTANSGIEKYIELSDM
jgi:hypothetical protein